MAMESTMLYDGNDFLLIYTKFRYPPEPGRAKGRSDFGYEVVDKHTSHYAYVTGQDAIALSNRIAEWQQETPHEQEVINILARFAALSCNFPITHH